MHVVNYQHELEGSVWPWQPAQAHILQQSLWFVEQLEEKECFSRNPASCLTCKSLPACAGTCTLSWSAQEMKAGADGCGCSLGQRLFFYEENQSSNQMLVDGAADSMSGSGPLIRTRTGFLLSLISTWSGRSPQTGLHRDGFRAETEALPL